MEKEDLIKEFIEFERASNDKWSDLYKQIKDDRKYINGDQHDDLDKTLLGDTATKCQLNIVGNAIRTIRNTYLENQYKWNYPNQDELNRLGDEFLSDIDNCTSTVEGLSNAIGTRIGCIGILNRPRHRWVC